MSTSIFEYKGYSYVPHIDTTERTARVWHVFTDPEGKEVECDFRSFRMMLEEDIRAWIDLGCPPRRDPVVPLNSDILKEMVAERDSVSKAA